MIRRGFHRHALPERSRQTGSGDRGPSSQAGLGAHRAPGPWDIQGERRHWARMSREGGPGCLSSSAVCYELQDFRNWVCSRRGRALLGVPAARLLNRIVEVRTPPAS
jgi:hypothetical protein